MFSNIKAAQIVSRFQQWSTSHGVDREAVRELLVGFTLIPGSVLFHKAFQRLLEAWDAEEAHRASKGPQ